MQNIRYDHEGIPMKLTIAIFSLLTSAPLLASALVCEGWYQASGGALEKAPMPIVEQTESNTVFKVEHRGYTYRVDWHKSLTTLYTTIQTSGKKVLFTTGRIPTENHPECFTDLNLPDGLRLSVNCEVK
jgi:hypothetical protein